MPKNITNVLFILIVSLTTISFQNKHQMEGVASYYHPDLHGKPTASGALYDQNKFSGAHPTLPFGTRVKVTNLKNQKSVVITINDRGPYTKNRVIDLSYAAAREIGLIEDGLTLVKLEKVSKYEN